MCRNIRTLFNFEPVATEEEIEAAATQYVRKVSGFTKPSQANEESFRRRDRCDLFDYARPDGRSFGERAAEEQRGGGREGEGTEQEAVCKVKCQLTSVKRRGRNPAMLVDAPIERFPLRRVWSGYERDFPELWLLPSRILNSRQRVYRHFC